MTNTEEHPLPPPPFGPGPADVPDFRFLSRQAALEAGFKPYPSRPDELSWDEVIAVAAEAEALDYEEDYLASVLEAGPPDDPIDPS